MNVETERLRLREFRPDDTASIYALESQPDVVKYQTFAPMNEDDAEKYVQSALTTQSALPRKIYDLVVELKESREFIGRVGMKINPKERHGDLWYSFLPTMHGKGYAAEAIQAFISQAPKLQTFGIECDPRNDGSRKLAKRLGFKEVKFEEKAFESKGEWVGSVQYVKNLSD